MPHRPLDLTSLETSCDRWDVVIEWVLIGLLAFMPLAFGAVEAWSEMVVLVAAASMCICFALKLLLSSHARIVWTWTYVPIVLFLLLVAFQLLPLPTDIVALLSPGTVATKASLLSDLANEPTVDAGRMTLSFYPKATERHLRLMLIAATVFVVVVNTYHHSRQVKRLLTAIAAIGGLFALLAILQVITGATSIYWTLETESNAVATAGSFINHSHYAQFMNLSLGAALALLLVRLEELSRSQPRSYAPVTSILRQLQSRSVWWLAAMVVVGGVSILTSLSRNGVLSMLIAGSLIGVVLASSRNLQWRGWLLATLPLVGFAALLFVGVDAVYNRLATIQDVGDDLRWEMVLGAIAAWREYPIFGAGLGTHEMVFPMFDPAPMRSLAAHADCDYAQMLEEMGVLGVALAATFLAGIWWSFCRLIWRGKTPMALAAFGLGFGLIAIMIHSTTDFGQHLPANFCLTAIACGLLICLCRREGRGRGEKGSDMLQAAASQKFRWLAASALVAILPVWGWALVDANAARVAENEWAHAFVIERGLRNVDWQGSDEQYVELLRRAEAAAKYEPNNVEYEYWLNLYRWHSVSRDTDPETGQIVLHPDALPHIERIADELSRSRLICPTFGPVYSLEGQLRLFVLEQPVGGELITKGYHLAPHDPPTCFVAGIHSMDQGDIGEAAARFERAVALNGSYYGEVVSIYVHELDRPDLARQLAGDDYRRLIRLSDALSNVQKNAELAEAIRGEAFDILRKRCESPDASAYELATLAGIYQKEGDFASAADHYRHALILNYAQTSWRLALARALAELGQIDDAMHEARICLRLQPELEAAKRLIRKLSVADRD